MRRSEEPAEIRASDDAAVRCGFAATMSTAFEDIEDEAHLLDDVDDRGWTDDVDAVLQLAGVER